MRNGRIHMYRHVSSLNEPLWNGHYLASGYLGIMPVTKLELFENRRHLRLASVRYAHGTTRVFPIEDYLDRVRLVTTLKRSPDPIEAIEHIDLESTVVCDKSSEYGELTGPILAESESVTLLTDENETMQIAVYVEYARILVVSDSWSPYWEVEVDGKDRELIPLFGKVMRGIVVHPEDRIVSMTYKPKPLYLGFALAILGIVIGLVYCLVMHRA